MTNERPLPQTQEELEARGVQDYADRITKEHQKLSARDYFSASGFGRRLVSSTRIEELAGHIREAALAGGQHPGSQLMADALMALGLAIKTSDVNKKAPRYAAPLVSGSDILAVITLRTAVDFLALSTKTDKGIKGQWPAAVNLVQRLSERVHTQYLDAYCYLLNPEVYGKTSKRWQRKHQGPKNKKTNIALGQRSMVAKHVGIELISEAAKAEAREKLQEVKWSRHQQNDIGRLLLDAVMQLDLFERLPTEWESAGRNDMTRIRPTEALVEEYHRALPEMIQDRLIAYPLIEEPEVWQHTDGEEGRSNFTGGYHREALRQNYPLVRSYKGGNTTVASELAVEFVNTLGATAFVPDQGMIDSFFWAIENKYEEAGVPVAPKKSLVDLDNETALNRANIQEQGCVIDNGRRLERGTPEHDVWKARRKKEYETAIEMQARYLRTHNLKDSLKQIRSMPVLFHSWSYDYRCRTYPQQTQVSVQGTAPEKALLKFRDGEQINVGTEAFNEALLAIGCAWKGNKMSLDNREDAGIQAVTELLPHITQIDAADIGLMVKAGADEPWALLQLLRCYDRAIHCGGLWDVPVELDASQSGLQLLSGVLKDEAGLRATNVLLPSDYKRGDAPVDGYRSVVQEALLALPNMTKLSKEKPLTELHRHAMQQVLLSDAARDIAKSVVLPLPYGSKFDGTLAAMRKKAHKLNLDLIGGVTNTLSDLDAWKFSEEVLRGLTLLLRQTACEVYPAAMAALAWLEKLASLAIHQQMEKHAESDGAFTPTLHWQLHDGTNVEYWQNKMLARQVNTLSCGKLKLPLGPDPMRLDRRGMISAFAASVVHSFDGLLLREAFHGWGDRPLVTVHDCVRILPGDVGEFRLRIKQAFQTVCNKNSLESIAKGMGVSLDKLPQLPKGKADLSGVSGSEFIFH